MAGMYPKEETIELFGKKESWPGLDPKTGKFTNGSFTDPLVKPSYIPAETLNLILDNMSNLITALGGAPENDAGDQLASLFTSQAVPLSGVKRDEAGRAKDAPPEEDDDIARKAEVKAITPYYQVIEINGSNDTTVSLPDAAAETMERTYWRTGSGTGKVLFTTKNSQTINSLSPDNWNVQGGEGMIKVVPVDENWQIEKLYSYYDTGWIERTTNWGGALIEIEHNLGESFDTLKKSFSIEQTTLGKLELIFQTDTTPIGNYGAQIRESSTDPLNKFLIKTSPNGFVVVPDNGSNVAFSSPCLYRIRVEKRI